ncbi:MAG: hypothetical protein IIB30_06100, partial [Chloroflexi bacterium]|nr:hypothetical protein [Chloroflexota bacterium]
AERGITSDRPEALGQGDPDAVLEPSGPLADISTDDIGDLLGGGNVTMVAEEQNAEWQPEDDGQDGGEDSAEDDGETEEEEDN